MKVKQILRSEMGTEVYSDREEISISREEMQTENSSKVDGVQVKKETGLLQFICLGSQAGGVTVREVDLRERGEWGQLWGPGSPIPIPRGPTQLRQL